MNEQDQGATAPDETTPPAETPIDTPGTEATEAPDEAAGPDVEPNEAIEGSQGEQVGAPAAAPGFDPDRAVSTSGPPPEAQGGVPALADGENDGVEPQPEFARTVDSEGEAPETTPAAPSE